MNAYQLKDLILGTTESFTVTVTAEMMDSFQKISGDINPLHCDEEYAVNQGYSGRVVYGMLSASFYSTLAGVYLPGKHCLLCEVDTLFRSPVYIGDVLTIAGTVSEIHDTVGMITVKADIRNQKGIKVSKAKLRIGFTNLKTN